MKKFAVAISLHRQVGDSDTIKIDLSVVGALNAEEALGKCVKTKEDRFRIGAFCVKEIS